MNYSILGKTGLRVSRLSFGASALGGVFRLVDEAEAIARCMWPSIAASTTSTWRQLTAERARRSYSVRPCEVWRGAGISSRRRWQVYVSRLLRRRHTRLLARAYSRIHRGERGAAGLRLFRYHSYSRHRVPGSPPH